MYPCRISNHIQMSVPFHWWHAEHQRLGEYHRWIGTMNLLHRRWMWAHQCHFLADSIHQTSHCLLRIREQLLRTTLRTVEHHKQQHCHHKILPLMFQIHRQHLLSEHFDYLSNYCQSSHTSGHDLCWPKTLDHRPQMRARLQTKPQSHQSCVQLKHHPFQTPVASNSQCPNHKNIPPLYLCPLHCQGHPRLHDYHH
jgi:hypothetical protein